MTQWDSGAKWEPWPANPTPSLWSEVDAGVGWPAVIIGNVDVCELVTSVRWGLGRSSWLDGPEPGTAQVELNGSFAAHVGDPIRISAPPVTDLWVGYIDTVAETQEPDGTTTRLSAVTAFAKLLSADVRIPRNFAANDLTGRLLELATVAGVTAGAIEVAPSVGVLPQLLAVTGYTGTLSALLDTDEKASNAIVATGPNGEWRVLPRDALPVELTIDPIDLVDDSCPSELVVATSTPDHVRNAFAIAGTLTERPVSIGKYGRRAYEVPAGVAATAPPYSAGFFDAVSEPAPYAEASVPVSTRLAAVVPIAPFDYVRTPDETLYQVLGVDWQAAPDEWSAQLSLDRTQSSIANSPTTPPIDPPPSYATATDTFSANADGYAVKASGGVNAGNGASVDLLVGLLSDGQLARSFVKFSLAWSHPLSKITKVTSAKLRLHVGEVTCQSYGSSPGIRVQRVIDAWSEGTYGTRCAFSSSNALKYPGPSRTSTGEALRSVSGSEGALCEVTVTTIVEAWRAGSPNYGFALLGSSESSSSDRIVFWGRGGSVAASMRPSLVVTYQYEV